MVKRAVDGFKISRAVGVGDWLFTNGQMDIGDRAKVLNPGDIVAQTVSCMRSIYELIARADYRLPDLAQIQVFFLGAAVPDPGKYREMILAEFPECREVLLVMTQVQSFATVGHVVEIEAIAVRGPRDCIGSETAGVCGVRRGDWIFASSRVTDAMAPICDALNATLRQLNSDVKSICRVHAYFPSDLGPDQRIKIEKQIAQYFHGVPSTYHGAILPVAAKGEFIVELEVIGNSNPKAGTVAHGRAHPPANVDDWPFVEVVRCGQLVFTSGQFPLDPDGSILHADDIASQARVVMGRLASTLNRADVEIHDLVKIKTFFEGASNLENWLDNLNARMETLSDPGPASTGIEGLSPVVAGALLSVDGIAIAR
jgi:enamine deaminase RidA (YjgF/YER057c/UK114 family)